MNITLDQIITRDVISDTDRRKVAELEAEYARLNEEIEKYSPVNARRQIKLWRAEIEKNPAVADKLARKISTYADESIELRRAAKAKRNLFAHENLIPFSKELQEKFKSEIAEILEDEIETHAARCKRYGIEFADPVITAMEAELAKLDVFSSTQPSKLINVSPEFWAIEK